MLNIKDIVDLAKAGYKPSDVKELIAMTQAQVTDPVTEPEPAQVAEPVAEPVTEPVIEQVTEPAPEQNPEQLENEKLRKQIEELQMANTRKPVPIPERRSDEDVINDFVKSFM